MNFDMVLEKIFRGDFMNTVADGYGARSHPTLRAREFSIEKALEHFAKVGLRKGGGWNISKPQGKDFPLSYSQATGISRMSWSF